jgi:hypothetical protein
MLGVDYIYVDPDASRDEATGELPQGVFTSIYEGNDIIAVTFFNAFPPCHDEFFMLSPHSHQIRFWKDNCHKTRDV